MSCLDLDSKVKSLIEEVTIPSTNPVKYEKTEGKQAQIFAQLEKLGKRSVPFIIKYLDDRRPLIYRSIRLQNNPANQIESMRHYSPEKVVDALVAILNQLTGRRFGFIYNGATEAERDEAVAGWRNYLQEELAKDAYDCRP